MFTIVDLSDPNHHDEERDHCPRGQPRSASVASQGHLDVKGTDVIKHPHHRKIEES